MYKEILAYKCQKCGHVQYPMPMVCRKCKRNGPHEFDTEPLPRSGRLLTYTVVHNLPAQFEVPTIALGVVELDGGLRMTGQLRVPRPEMGMRLTGQVEIVSRGDYEVFYGMVFYDAAAKAAPVPLATAAAEVTPPEAEREAVAAVAATAPASNGGEPGEG
jgi:uncharacterized OB-fold protein